jgi:hypothetical protein
MADSILSLLEPGEYVLNRNAVDKLGKKALDEVNYNTAPRFPDKSILGDYFNQQQVPDFWSGIYNSLMSQEPSRKQSSSQSPPQKQSSEVDDAMEILKNKVSKYNEIPEFQGGGSVSYGGYDSEPPTLESLYEMFGVKPKGENVSRFQDYDPSREGIHREDYTTALDKAQTTGERGMEKIYEATAGAGGFSGSGAAEKARGRGRESLMEDYLSGQKSAYSTMFKGVRSERENWLKEMGGQLSALEEREGTDPFRKSYTPPGDESVVPSDNPAWSPPDPTGIGMMYLFEGGNYFWDGASWLTQQQWDDSGQSSASGDT